MAEVDRPSADEVREAVLLDLWRYLRIIQGYDAVAPEERQGAIKQYNDLLKENAWLREAYGRGADGREITPLSVMERTVSRSERR